MSGIHLAPGECDIRRIVQSIRQMMQGRDDATGNVTLGTSVTSTLVTAPNCASTSEVLLTAKTANAASGIASTYVSVIGSGSFTIAHVSSTQSDKKFSWTCRG